MNSRVIQAEIEKLQILKKQAELEEFKKKIDLEKQLKQQESNSLLSLKESWDLACEQQSIEQITTILDKMHAIPFTKIQDSDKIKDSNARRIFYKVGISSAIKQDNLPLLQLLWNDFNLLIPKLYAFPTSTCDLFKDKYADLNPLIFAILHKKEKCALWLLDQEINPNSLYSERYMNSNTSVFKDTALTLAIKNNLTELAKELIKLGAWLGKEYTAKIKAWEKDGSRYNPYGGDFGTSYTTRLLPNSFEPLVTPFMLAAQYNNKELVSFFIGRGASVLESDKTGKTVIDYTTNIEVRQLLLSTLTNQQRLNRINFYSNNTLPHEYLCSITKQVMTRPAKDSHGNYFCQEALLDQYRENPSAMHGLNGCQITKTQLLEMLSLPIDTTLQIKCKEFVEQAEAQITSSLTLQRRH